MASDKRQAPSGVAQLINQGMQRHGIPSWRKLEELCEVSYGYLQHLAEGHIRNPKEETLRRLAHVLGQRVEEYRAALLADHHELPAPVHYFSAHLGEQVDARAAELAMELLEELVRRRSNTNNN
jgi:transcriptional regulator with XRE-family HTH domain